MEARAATRANRVSRTPATKAGIGSRRRAELALWLWIAAVLGLYLWQFRDFVAPLVALVG
jgi:hypothetical protein